MTSTNDIRRAFLDYFKQEGHARVPSAPLVPHNDPTLMFVNAGMVPFKNVFTGLETRPYSTAVSSQKCVRAGGKHNDLDNVGYTARHHTFFEMLGNFSFGDYFKERAISLAWTLVSKEWALDPNRLCVTVYHTDDDAFELWRKISGLPESKIIRIPTNDNFWSMGDTGPCGPCSEIFWDHGAHIPGGPPGSPEEDGDRFTEIWNLVFMQYDQAEGGERTPLPRPSIDTGMGLERIAAVLQGVHDNYDTDTFRALIGMAAECAGADPAGPMRASLRVIADHLRASGFLVADGVLPANEGRGYVLRRIMRRAMRHAQLLGTREPLMHRLVPSLVAEMSSAYPELLRAQPLIEATLLQEETRFRQTLDKGLRLLEDATHALKPGATLPGAVAFKLYDTYGFPFDLTEDALRTQGLSVDRAGFDAEMAQQRAAARAAWKGSGANTSDDIWFDIAERHGATEFIGYGAQAGEGLVVALVRDGAEISAACAGDTVSVITNQTPFYAESGGQVGDTGTLSGAGGLAARITDTAKLLGKLHAHQTHIDAGTLHVGDRIQMAIDAPRRAAIRANHSATHLLHAALRKRLGAHVTQKGSLVAADRLRFDFAHPQALGAEDVAAIEVEVNAQIRGNTPVTTRLMSPEDAIAAGAMALFGEKYGDEVRVLGMGSLGHSEGDTPYSVELCGGTHVNALGDIGLFRIIGESAVSSGVRRIEALTGAAALMYLTHREDLLKRVAGTLKAGVEDVPARVEALVETGRRFERDLAEARRALAMAADGGAKVTAAEQVNGVQFVAQILHDFDPKGLRGLVDAAREKQGGDGIFSFVAVNDGKASLVVGVSPGLLGTHNATELVRAGVAALGGQGGGGRPDMAQGGGPDGAQADAALDSIRDMIRATA
ncbi:MAG: alanine--tRNA ligase [Alphaproteobacteria bacterium]|nr:alanine--tRNA ligase [Alphaproteobacteria bacterium]MDE2339830.1 alanine--tRNA ligase [Alphaproteobacteria bacterium]